MTQKPGFRFCLTRNRENFFLDLLSTETPGEDLHEGDIRLTPLQRLSLEMFGDPTARVPLARGLTNDPNLLWSSRVVPYIIDPALRTCKNILYLFLSQPVQIFFFLLTNHGRLSSTHYFFYKTLPYKNMRLKSAPKLRTCREHTFQSETVLTYLMAST